MDKVCNRSCGCHFE